MSPKQQMSDEHKAALAEGRRQGRAVRAYLDALEKHRPKRGRKRTAESVTKRLETIAETIGDAEPIDRLQMIQERIDLEAELDSMQNKADLSELETGFVEAAKGYSDRKGITYAAWRELGVEPAVLKAAGISRSRS